MKYFSLAQQWILFVLSLLLISLFCFKFFYHAPNPPGKKVNEFVVELSGEVRNPGIYLFQEPPTLMLAIEKAGGLKESASFDKGSSSEISETGTLLTVVKESGNIKVKFGRMEARKLILFSIPLDLNRVSMEDLCLIPGIGETLAHEIVTYRERRKGFRSVDELKNVKGVGEKKYKDLKGCFTIK